MIITIIVIAIMIMEMGNLNACKHTTLIATVDLLGFNVAEVIVLWHYIVLQ